MVELKKGDFVELEFNIEANGKLIQTTNKELGEKNKLNIQKYKPMKIILGKSFILGALDNNIIKTKGKATGKLELKPEEAYGKRKKELIKTFKKSVFDEQKMNAVAGMTYDFNGSYGMVKSVIGGRVLVDFNNPLAGKNIVLEYTKLKKITKVSKKLVTIFEEVLKIPENMFKVSEKDKIVKIEVPKEILAVKAQLIKSFGELITEIKDYKLNFVEIKIKKLKK